MMMYSVEFQSFCAAKWLPKNMYKFRISKLISSAIDMLQNVLLTKYASYLKKVAQQKYFENVKRKCYRSFEQDFKTENFLF